MIYFFALFMSLLAAQGQQPPPCKVEGGKIVPEAQQCILQGQKSCGGGFMTIHSYQTDECKAEQVLPFTICANTQGHPCNLLKNTEMFTKDTNFEDWGKCFKWSLNQFNNKVTCMDKDQGGGGDDDACPVKDGKIMHTDVEKSCKLPTGMDGCGEGFITMSIFQTAGCQQARAKYCGYFPPGVQCSMIEKDLGGFGQCREQETDGGDKYYMSSMCKDSGKVEIDCKSDIAVGCKTCVTRCAQCIGKDTEECKQCEACTACIPYVKCYMNEKGCADMEKKGCRKAKDKCKWDGKKESCGDKKQKKVKCKKFDEDTCAKNDACVVKKKKGSFKGCKNKKN